jgi:hypothetical protein
MSALLREFTADLRLDNGPECAGRNHFLTSWRETLLENVGELRPLRWVTRE